MDPQVRTPISQTNPPNSFLHSFPGRYKDVGPKTKRKTILSEKYCRLFANKQMYVSSIVILRTKTNERFCRPFFIVGM